MLLILSNRLFFWDECQQAWCMLNYVHSPLLHCLHTCIAWVWLPSKGLTREWQLRLGAGPQKVTMGGWVMWMGIKLQLKVPRLGRQWKNEQKKKHRGLKLNIQEGNKTYDNKLRKINWNWEELLIETGDHWVARTCMLLGQRREGICNLQWLSAWGGRRWGCEHDHRGTYSWSLSRNESRYACNSFGAIKEAVSLK